MSDIEQEKPQEFEEAYMIINPHEAWLQWTIRDLEIRCINVFLTENVGEPSFLSDWDKFLDLGYKVKKIKIQIIGD